MPTMKYDLCCSYFVLYCPLKLLCFIHVPVHTFTETFSVVSLIGQVALDQSATEEVTFRSHCIMLSVTFPCPEDARHRSNITPEHSFDFGC